MSNLPEIPTEDLLSFHDYKSNDTAVVDLSNVNTYNENKAKITEDFDVNLGADGDKNLDEGTNTFLKTSSSL